MKKLSLFLVLCIAALSSFCQDTPNPVFDGKVAFKAPDAIIVSYKWEQVAGPNTAIIATPDAASTTVSGLAAGDYVFRFTVTDNFGFVGTDDKAVKVLRYSPAPVADAGEDLIIQLGKPE